MHYDINAHYIIPTVVYVMCCIIDYRGARHGFKMNGKLARLEVQDSLTNSPAAAQSDGSSTDEAEEKTRVSKYVTIYYFDVLSNFQLFPMQLFRYILILLWVA